MSKSIKENLQELEVEPSTDLNHLSFRDEFNFIKKKYFSLILIYHPDKGGDEDKFRSVQSSFRLLKHIFTENLIDLFCNHLSSTLYGDYIHSNQLEKPWEYYAEASSVPIPIVKMEHAKSGRGKCHATGAAKKCGDGNGDELINKNSIRISPLDITSGKYSRWVHVNCWRIPSKVCLGLPNPITCQDKSIFNDAMEEMNEVVITGYNELSNDEKDILLSYIMQPNLENDKKNGHGIHWVKPVNTSNNRFSQIYEAAIHPSHDTSVDKREETKSEYYDTSPTSVVQKKELFSLIPGVNGAENKKLANKIFVLTGTFPELGGSMGLHQGKDKLKVIIETFGGKVTNAISGKTDFLIAGKDPGYNKVSQARERDITLLTLKQLKDYVECKQTLEDVQSNPIQISNFSSGYSGNAINLSLKSAEDIALAMTGRRADNLLMNNDIEQSKRKFDNDESKIKKKKSRK